MFFKMLSSIEVIICQIDRFMALYLNAEYNNYFDLSFSLKICTWRLVFSCDFSNTMFFFSKIICFMPPLLTLALGSDLHECPPSFSYSSLSTHKVNTFFSAIPKCVTALVVIIVSLYVLSVLKRILRQVVPSTNLPQPQPLERNHHGSGQNKNVAFKLLGSRLTGTGPAEDPVTLYTIDVPFIENLGSGNPSHPNSIFPMAELNSVGMPNDMEVTKINGNGKRESLQRSSGSL